VQALVSKLKGSSAAAVAAAAPSSAAASSAAAAAAAAAAAVVSHPQLASPGGSILTAGAGGLSSAAGGGASLGKDAKAVVSSEAGVVRSVLATLGALAQQAGTGFKPYVGEVMPLVIEAIQVCSFAQHKGAQEFMSLFMPVFVLECCRQTVKSA
jgi:hypothetical protein